MARQESRAQGPGGSAAGPPTAAMMAEEWARREAEHDGPSRRAVVEVAWDSAFMQWAQTEQNMASITERLQRRLREEYDLVRGFCAEEENAMRLSFGAALVLLTRYDRARALPSRRLRLRYLAVMSDGQKFVDEHLARILPAAPARRGSSIGHNLDEGGQGYGVETGFAGEE